MLKVNNTHIFIVEEWIAHWEELNGESGFGGTPCPSLVVSTNFQRLTDPSPTLGRQAGVILAATSPGWLLGWQEET